MSERRRKPPVVLLSGVRWDFLWQRHQTLATLFARAGYPTVFVESTGLSNPKPKVSSLRNITSRLSRRISRRPGREGPESNLSVYSPLVLPPTSRAFRRINGRFLIPRVAREVRETLEALGAAGEAPVVVAYPPTQSTLDLLAKLEPRTVLYDCSDEYAAFPGAARDLAETERELLSRAELVSCTSEYLLQRVGKIRPDAFLSGPAVAPEFFDPSPKAPARDLERAAVTACFFGDPARERIDFDVLESIVAAGFGLRVVGGVERRDRAFLRGLGVEVSGAVAHQELPRELSGADVFVLPYKINRMTVGISPAKTYECLATGKPVICAPLPAMKSLDGHVYLAEEPEDYARVLGELRNTETEEKVRARRALALENSWEARFSELEERIWRELEAG